eukprot:gene259-357_t
MSCCSAVWGRSCAAEAQRETTSRLSDEAGSASAPAAAAGGAAAGPVVVPPGGDDDDEVVVLLFADMVTAVVDELTESRELGGVDRAAITKMFEKQARVSRAQVQSLVGKKAAGAVWEIVCRVSGHAAMKVLADKYWDDVGRSSYRTDVVDGLKNGWRITGWRTRG